ncbi:MAG: FG-GAP-like repeat-containing protein [Acidimicrobiales bacterium]
MRRASLTSLTVSALLLVTGTSGRAQAAPAGEGAPDGPTISAQEQLAAAQLPGVESDLGDAYGGAWFDESGVLHVGVAGSAPAIAAPDGVQLDGVTFSVDDLTAVHDAIAADVASGALDAWGVATVAIRPQDQAVVVGVTGDLATAGPDLVARYGDAVVAEPVTPPQLASRSTDQRLTSGLELTSSQSVGFVGCTSAFGTHISTLQLVTTAGHCQETATSAQWRVGESAPPFGSSTRKTFGDGSRADSLVIAVPPGKASLVDCVYESDAVCRPVSGYVGTLYPGQTVCKSGFRTGTTCGRITDVSTTVNFGGVVLRGLVRMCGIVNAGDSGAGVYHVVGGGAAVADGILSGSTNDSSCPGFNSARASTDPSNVILFSLWRNVVSPTVGQPLRNGYRESTDFSGDPCADILGIYGTYLIRYDGACTGGFASGGTVIGSGWDGFLQVLRPGDFTGDGCADVVGVPPDGRLLLYRGNCAGGFASGAGTLIGTGWNAFTGVLAPGDFNGDGCSDLLGTLGDGRLLLYYGSCAGGFLLGGGTTIGTGWNAFDQIITPGDWSGDGCTDLLARFPDGRLRAYYGSCTGGFVGAGADNGGWQIFSDIIGSGDWTGDGCADLVARLGGTLRWYGGTCAGGFTGPGVDFSTGWESFSSIR